MRTADEYQSGSRCFARLSTALNLTQFLIQTQSGRIQRIRRKYENPLHYSHKKTKRRRKQTKAGAHVNEFTTRLLKVKLLSSDRSPMPRITVRNFYFYSPTENVINKQSFLSKFKQATPLNRRHSFTRLVLAMAKFFLPRHAVLSLLTASLLIGSSAHAHEVEHSRQTASKASRLPAVDSPSSSENHYAFDDSNLALTQSFQDVRYQELNQSIQQFLTTLDDSQRATVVRSFDDPFRTRAFCYVLARCNDEYVGPSNGRLERCPKNCAKQCADEKLQRRRLFQSHPNDEP